MVGLLCVLLPHADGYLSTHKLLSVSGPRMPPLKASSVATEALAWRRALGQGPRALPLKSAAADAAEGGVSPPAPKARLDKSALVTYFVALGLQFGSIYIFLWGVQEAFRRLNVGFGVALWFARFFFAFMSLRSRVFSVLDNSRPRVADEAKEIQQRKRPSWMPPPFVFPIVWTTIAVLRTVSSSIIFENSGSLLARPLLFFYLHLCVGDVWNTINNVEKRLGAAVPGVFAVWLSVVAAVRAYYKFVPLAGLVLLPSAVWISIANVLVCSIWALNGKEPLYPTKRDQ